MAHKDRDFSQRDVVDKLGSKTGQAIALPGRQDGLGDDLYRRIIERTGRPLAVADEPVDVVIVPVRDLQEAAAALQD